MEKKVGMDEHGDPEATVQHNVKKSPGTQVGDYNIQINLGRLLSPNSQADAGGRGDTAPGIAPHEERPVISSDLDVTLWGPTASGKTTYLGALNVAVARANPRWTLTGGHWASTDRLIEMTADLVGRGEFPVPTRSMDTLAWHMSGTVDDGVSRVPAKFGLSVADPPGESFSPRNSGGRVSW